MSRQCRSRCLRVSCDEEAAVAVARECTLGPWVCCCVAQYAECIAHYKTALEINPYARGEAVCAATRQLLGWLSRRYFPTAWFAMGFAAIELNDFHTAVLAFTRTVAIEPEVRSACATRPLLVGAVGGVGCGGMWMVSCAVCLSRLCCG